MEELKEKLIKLEAYVSRLVNHSENTREMLEGIIAKADENFVKIDDRLSKIEHRLNSLTNETSTNFSDVSNQLGGIKDEITKIGIATRYEQGYQDMIKFNIPN